MAYGKNKLIAVVLAIMVAMTWSFPAFAADDSAPEAEAEKYKTEAVSEEPAPPEKDTEEESEPAEESDDPAGEEAADHPGDRAELETDSVSHPVRIIEQEEITVQSHQHTDHCAAGGDFKERSSRKTEAEHRRDQQLNQCDHRSGYAVHIGSETQKFPEADPP